MLYLISATLIGPKQKTKRGGGAYLVMLRVLDHCENWIFEVKNVIIQMCCLKYSALYCGHMILKNVTQKK